MKGLNQFAPMPFPDEARTVQKDVYDRYHPVSHTEHQPDPVRVEGRISTPVLPYVLQDFRDKAGVGLDKYQTMLRTNNGRDALADAYQEAVDKVMYLKQLLLEQDFEAGVGLQDLKLDTDLEQEKAEWEQRESTRSLQNQLLVLREQESRLRSQAEAAHADLQKVLKMLRRVALKNYETPALLDLLLDMYKKYGE